jgi:predicted permease
MKFPWRRREQQLKDELQTHLQMAASDHVDHGESPEAAAQAARREFGNVSLVLEVTRDQWRRRWLDELVQDLRYAARMLRKNPGFTLVAVLTLALGIGANTAMFSVIEAVLLRPLPYKDPAKLVVLADAKDPDDGGFLYKDFERCRSEARSFESMAAYYRNSGISRVTLTASNEPEQVKGAFVSHEFFRTMGIAPQLGRAFSVDEEVARAHVLVLSHGLWLRRFGASPDVIGQKLQIDGAEWNVIGVMPSTFAFPNRDQQFWAPITTNRSWQEPALTTNIDPSNTRMFFARWTVVGRLKPGITLVQSQAEINSLFAQLAQSDPDRNRAPVRVSPLGIKLSTNTRLALFILFGAVFCVLLIACSNVANLVLARGAGRDREMALRTALGAGRARLTRQLFTESALLALLSGGFGVSIASVALRALIAFAPGDIPRLEQAGLDGRVLAFTLAVSFLAAVLFGLIPAWKISHSDPNESLKQGGHGALGSVLLRRMRDLLVVGEFALAIVLLAGAGLLVRSFLAVESVDLGFRPERVLTLRVTMPAGTAPSRTVAFHKQVLERVAALPGVEAVGAISDQFELSTLRKLGLRAIDGHAPELPENWTPLIWQTISGDYLQAMEAPLLRGRYPSEQDGLDSPLVALIDENTARRYLGNEDPIGKRFKGQDARGKHDDWLTVIGVFGNMRRNGLEREPVPHVFVWYTQEGGAPQDLVVRTTGDPRMAATVRGVIRGLDPVAILSPVKTINEELSEQLSPRRFQTSLLTLFSLLALLLAGVGVFAVLHYSVAQRAHEMGVRIALGAQSVHVLSLVLRSGVRLALIGVVFGMVAASALTRLMSSLLYGVSPTDPATYTSVSLLLMSIAMLASYLPARRAMRVDPIVALRHE